MSGFLCMRFSILICFREDTASSRAVRSRQLAVALLNVPSGVRNLSMTTAYFPSVTILKICDGREFLQRGPQQRQTVGAQSLVFNHYHYFIENVSTRGESSNLGKRPGVSCPFRNLHDCAISGICRPGPFRHLREAAGIDRGSNRLPPHSPAAKYS